jgi:hypothetical protein
VPDVKCEFKREAEELLPVFQGKVGIPEERREKKHGRWSLTIIIRIIIMIMIKLSSLLLLYYNYDYDYYYIIIIVIIIL